MLNGTARSTAPKKENCSSRWDAETANEAAVALPQTQTSKYIVEEGDLNKI